jgi:Holliday junction DNA helicase RuvA
VIGQITGILKTQSEQQLLIDVHGIGYEVDVPASVLMSGLAAGSEISLHTHFVVREDAQILFGFLDQASRDLFRALIKVNKVGPRIALAILSHLDANAFAACVRQSDIKTLNAIPGVGRVMAERLVMELSGRLDDLIPVTESQHERFKSSPPSHLMDELEGALVGLGFRPQEIALALSQLEPPPDNIEDGLRRALKLLG